MANEDVLERAGRFVNDELGAKFRTEVCSLVESLIAALREARERNEGMRGELHRIVGQAFDLGTTHPGGPSGFALHELTEMVDAAMKPPGGEGSSHE